MDTSPSAPALGATDAASSDDHQGLSGLATRKPKVSNLTWMLRLSRMAARTIAVSLRPSEPSHRPER